MNFGQKCAVKIAFFGTPSFGAFIFESLIKNDFAIVVVVTQPNKPKGRQKDLSPSPVKQLAIKNKIAVLQPLNLKESFFIKQLKSYKLDLIIVASYGKIIPKEVLNLAKYGNLNVHGSLLPKLRGASPIATAIKEGFKETGITIMLMNEKMDAGPILTQVKIEIEPKETTLTLEHKLQKAGAQLLINTIPLFLADKIKPQEQNHHEATYTKIIKKEDGLINWNNQAIAIEKQIRAFCPWPGSFTFWRSKRLKIITAQVINESHKPGEVFIHQDEIAIGAHVGSILIKKIQLESKRKMSSAEFLKGYKQIIGAQLTS